jgi:rod shape-determining protein MreB and related proteins
MLAGLDQRIAHETDIDVHLVESALECVVLGAGRCIEEPAALRVVFQAER